MKVFFDLDPAVYMAAFASQKAVYSIVFENDKGKLVEKFFEDGNAKLKFVRALKKERPDVEIEETKELVVEPPSNARQAARTIIERALFQIRRKFKVDEIDEITYYLTGKGNWRDDIATILEYKAGRPPKPEHYQVVRDYYINSWGAEVIDGMEADDAVSIACWDEIRKGNSDYVLATIDKDLDQIPGWHYDYKKHVFYDIDDLDGELAFYTQILSGDSTDNIRGVFRVGTAKAEALINEWFETALEENKDWRRVVWKNIVKEFEANREQYGPDKTFPQELSAEQAALETARLVYMQQEEGELWTPPTE